MLLIKSTFLKLSCTLWNYVTFYFIRKQSQKKKKAVSSYRNKNYANLQIGKTVSCFVRDNNRIYQMLG